MANVYKFKVRLNELEDIIWRDIEITSVSSIAKLGYTILAAFGGTGSHLFNIQFNGNRYEIVFDDGYSDFGIVVIDPTTTKLSELNLKVGDVLTMDYDYGAGWKFNIELLSVEEMKKGAGSHYPYVTDGKSKGFLEDTSPGELYEAIQYTDKTGKAPEAHSIFTGERIKWDYRKFDLKICNGLLKGDIISIQKAYEQII